MGQNLTNFDAMLKDFYEGALREQLNNEIKMFKELERSSKSWSGRKVVWPAHLNRNGGVGARAETVALPTAGNQQTVASNITASYNYGRVDLTGQAMAAGKHAFAEALAFELEGVKDDLSFDLGRQTYGEGLGILGRIAADFTQGCATITNQYSVAGSPGARYVHTGMVISSGSAASPESGHCATNVCKTIVATNSGTTTDTVQGCAAFSGTAGDFIFRSLSGGEGNEMKGLRALIDDPSLDSAANCYGRSAGFLTATIQAISRTTYSKWKANVDANSGVKRVLDSALMQKAFDTVKKNSGKDIDLIIGEYSVISAFLDSVSGDRRYATKDFDSGRGALSYNGVSLIQDLLAPYNEIFLLNKAAVKQYVLKDISFADHDDRIIKNVAGYDRWEAFLCYYGNIGIEQPLASMAVRDVIPAS